MLLNIGNSLDVQKSIEVKFKKQGRNYIWVIVDQGSGFSPPKSCHWPFQILSDLPEKSQECGRGIFILYQIFDEVLWSDNGTELQLSKTLV